MIKAIFFDVDGTLVSHTQKAVPDSTQAALRALEQKHIRRVLATGRHMLELAELPVRGISFDGYITLNGQLCLDRDGALLWGNPMTGAGKDRLLALFRERELPLLLVEQDRMYINRINQQVRLAQAAISTPLPELGAYTGNPIYQAIAFIGRDQEAALARQLPGCRITRWNDCAVDILSDCGGKAAGIQAYLRSCQIRQSETMAFGDGENDMEMLQYVQIGVAMGNAGSAVKACADYVTADVDSNGIEQALKVYQIL